MSQQSFRIADTAVHPELNRIERSGRTHRLTPRLMQVLLHLAANPGRVVTREELLDAIWQDLPVNEEVVTGAISQLRRAFGGTAKGSVIETIPKKGYRLVAAVETVEVPVSFTSAAPTVWRAEPRRAALAFGFLAAFALLALFARFGAGWSGPSSPGPDPSAVPELELLDASDYSRRGFQYLEAGSSADLENARHLFLQVLAAEPDHVEALAGLAQVLATGVRRFGHPPESLEAAFEHARRAAALEPGSPVAQRVLGELYEISGQPRLARAHYESAVRAAPEDAVLAVRIGELYYFDRDYPAALAWLGRAWEKTPLEGSIAARIGEILMHLDDLERSAEWYRRAADLEPLQGSHRAGLGTVYLLLGDRQRAPEPCRNLLASRPEDLSCTLKMGELAMLEGDTASARNYFSRVVELRPDVAYYVFRLAHAILEDGDPRRAEDMLVRVEELLAARDVRRFNWADNWVLAAVHSLRGDEEGATTWLERAIESGRLLHRWDSLDPAFEPLRGSAGFEDYLATMRSQAAGLRRQLAASI